MPRSARTGVANRDPLVIPGSVCHPRLQSGPYQSNYAPLVWEESLSQRVHRPEISLVPIADEIITSRNRCPLGQP